MVWMAPLPIGKNYGTRLECANPPRDSELVLFANFQVRVRQVQIFPVRHAHDPARRSENGNLAEFRR